MIKFIEKWWAEIFLIISAISYLHALISDKDWSNLIVVICLYIAIGLLYTITRIKDRINDLKQERIDLLMETLHRFLK